MRDTPIAIPHVHQWFTMPAMKVGQGRCMTCGMWSQEFDAQAAELAAALAELANVKDDFDTAIAQRDKLAEALKAKDLTKLEPDWVNYRVGFDSGFAEAQEQAAKVCDEQYHRTYMREYRDCATAIRALKECGK